MTQPSLAPVTTGNTTQLTWVNDASQCPTPTGPCLSTITAAGDPLGPPGSKVWANTIDGLLLP